MKSGFLFLCLSTTALAIEPGANLIQNSDAERLVDGSPVAWQSWNPQTASIVSDPLREGNVIRVGVDQMVRGAAVETNSFKVEPHSLLSVAAWVRGEDVRTGEVAKNWHGFRMTLRFYDKTGKTRIRHHEVMIATGSFDWTRARKKYLVPEGAAQARLSFQLSHAKGEFWVDDVEASVIAALHETQETAERKKVADPVIHPKPFQVVYGQGQIAAGNWKIETQPGDSRLAAWLEAESKLPTGDKGHNVRLAFERAVNEAQLGEEGYQLAVEPAQVTITANTEVGRFYGLQTLLQIVSKEKTIPRLTIVDFPTISRRGIPVGFHWFRQREELIRRLTTLKAQFRVE